MPATKPVLDAKLAEPCRQLPKPEAADYDAWLIWIRDEVLPAYAECRSRHRRLVGVWPK